TAGLLLLAIAPSVPMMVLAWCVVQVSLNASFAAITAAVPDRAPHRQRGTVGGYLGIAQTVGYVTGAGLAALAAGIVGGYLACIGFLLLATIPYVLLRHDTPLRTDQRAPWNWRSFLAGFWISPRRYPDFGWAWLTRFLMNLGFSTGIVYLLYFLSDRVHHPDPKSGVFTLNVVNAVTLLGTVLIAGVLSDRLGKRRIFVCWAGIVMGAGTLLLAFWPTWVGGMVAA